MTEQLVNFHEGGMCVVMIGNTGFVKEYARHAQVKFIDTHDIEGDLLETTVPSNTKLVILTEGLPQYHYQWIMAFCRRKNVPYIVRKTIPAIYEELKKRFSSEEKPTVTEVKEVISKGKLSALLPFIDFSLSNAENGRRLVKKAAELNIKTTEASLIQLAANHRKKLSGGTVPKSVRPKLDLSVEMLESMIKDLTGMKEFLIEITEENRILKQKLERYKKLAQALED